MKMEKNLPLIKTEGEKCRLCYTCVRDCPAKAIRISNGQAEVIGERCIGCGNCIRVCSQKAKHGYDSTSAVKEILGSGGIKAAIIAPSFPAEFRDIPYQELVGMLRKMGFDKVSEVSFGADLVAAEYKKLLAENPRRRYIATTCPGIVTYIEKYHPGLVNHLAPVASPMVATARAMKQLHGDDIKVVFIGPCFAKKVEAAKDGSVEAVLTFTELRKMLSDLHIEADEDDITDFDPPHPGLGALFPLSGGMLQAADLKVDLLDGEIVIAEGKTNFVQAIKEFEEGAFDTRLLEVLCCNGCIMGSGMNTENTYFSRRNAVSKYVRDRIAHIDSKEREKYYDDLVRKLDMSAHFEVSDMRLPLPSKAELDKIMHRMGKFKPEDELDCGACGYPTCREHAIAIHKGLAESEMCLPFTIERLKQSLNDLSDSNRQLESTKQALFNAEKLASMGQLSAGIAHEINNPLGVILLNSELMLEECEKGSEQYEDLKMICEQAERCKKIVSDLLNFARKNKVMHQPTNMQKLIGDCLRAIVVPSHVEISVEHHLDNPMAEVDSDQIIQVLTNLIMNAAEAIHGKGTIKIITSDTQENIKIVVEDNGAGIPRELLNKIFEPLFTTKQIGMGTGLGLAVTYGIIKMHRGQIDVTSNADPGAGPTGTKFTVTLPRKEHKNGAIGSI